MNKHLLKKSRDLVLKKFNVNPQIAIITGSGIKLFKDYNPICKIKYSDLPVFPKSNSKSKNGTVKGHNRELLLYKVENKNILIFSGRFHMYEGLSFEDVTAHILLANSLGIKKVLVTNAAGGINKKLKAGDLMLIDSFIDLMQSTERGVLSGIIEKPKKVSNKFQRQVQKLGKLKTGTYAGMHGPTYETYSEIKLLKTLGADAVGMSTVPEIICGNSLNLDITGISIISNVWDLKHKPSHLEVLENVKKANNKLNQLVDKIVDII